MVSDRLEVRSAREEYRALRNETGMWQAAQIAVWLTTILINAWLMPGAFEGSPSAAFTMLFVGCAAVCLHCLIAFGMHRPAPYIRDKLFDGDGWESSPERNNWRVKLGIGIGGAGAMLFTTVLPFFFAVGTLIPLDEGDEFSERTLTVATVIFLVVITMTFLAVPIARKKRS